VLPVWSFWGSYLFGAFGGPTCLELLGVLPVWTFGVKRELGFTLKKTGEDGEDGAIFSESFRLHRVEAFARLPCAADVWLL
jgi:uncharacterized membrane protein